MMKVKPKRNEHEIQLQILEFLRYNHFKVLRVNSGAIRTERGNLLRFGEVGAPDVIAWKNGITYCIEVKAPGGKATPSQLEWLQDAREHGLTALIAYSVEDVITALAALGPK